MEAVREFFKEWNVAEQADSRAQLELYLFEVLVQGKPATASLATEDLLPEGDTFEGAAQPTAILFCKTRQGETVTVTVTGWKPWFRLLSLRASVDWSKMIDAFSSSKAFVAKTEQQRVHKLYGFVAESSRDLTTKAYDALKVYTHKTFQADQMADYYRKWQSDSVLVADTLQKPKIRFLHDTGLCPCAWFSIRGLTRKALKRPADDDYRISISTYELTCSVDDLIPDLEKEDVPPLISASFDGEMSSYDGLVPTPFKGDQLFCLSTAFCRFGLEGIKTVSLYMGPHSAVSSSTHLILPVQNARQMIETWRHLIQYVNPDFVTGWNVDGFDNAFLANAYNVLFLPNHHRVREQLLHGALELLGKSQTPLAELCKRLTNGQRAGILETMRKSHGAPVAQLAKPTLGFTDGAVSMLEEVDADEEEQDVASALEPHHFHHLRELVCEALGECEDQIQLDALLDAMSAKQRSEYKSQLDKKYGPDAAELLTAKRIEGTKSGFFLSRLLCEESKLQTRVMNTAAKGDNIMQKIPMTGRVCMDMMRIIKDDQKPASNALRFAADEWLTGVSKLDMPISELFQIYKTKDKDGATRVIEYCARDAEIPLLLMNKLQYITSWLGLCRVCYLNPDTIINGGQQQRVFSLISRRVRDTHAVNIEPSGWPATPDYVGATVITPKAGFYSKPLSTLDFASLYPSIEASNNLCFSTLVTNRSQLSFLKTSDGRKLYQDFEIEHPTSDGGIETRRYAFVTHVRSVLADLLIHLLSSRKAVKRQMEAAEDPFLYEVYNKRQLALKVVCNSVYGFTGVDVEKGMLSCKPVAAATTLIGRRLIGLTKDFVEANYKGAFVAYGDTDSVMIHWGVDTLEEAFHLGEDAAKKVTQYLRSVMQGEQATVGGKEQRDVKAMTEILKLEHEKEYWPYLLFKKKNYAGRKWTPKSLNPLVLKDTIDKKGIQAVRRDTIPFIADISNQILDALLLENSTEKAIQLVRDGLKAVSLELIPFDKYITSKSIKGSYSNMSIPHVLAWQRMRDRGDDDLPPVGGRMPFVILAGDTPLATRAEHPVFAQSSKKKLDTEYYITAAINPLQKLLQFATDQHTLDDVFQEALNTSTSRSTKSLLEFLSGDEQVSEPKLAGTKRVALEKAGGKKKREKKETSLDAFFT